MKSLSTAGLCTKFCVLGCLALVVSTTWLQAAYSWGDFQFGGFASQGYLVNTGRNDYLGDTSSGTFDFREYALNASWAKSKWRVGAQIFGQKLGQYGNDELRLDWASIDYQAAQWFGLRVGRVKLPRGLYNEALDVDSVRPFILLPQSIYDNRIRDFNASFDGGMIYGNIGLRRFGSLDYTVYYGDTPISTDSGASDFFNTDSPFRNVDIGIDSLIGGTLFWNPPVPGLRMGYSHTTYNDLLVLRHIVIPARHVDAISPNRAKTYNHDQLSIEYIWGDWTFATEAARATAFRTVIADGSLYFKYKSELFYVSAARRINSWLELGTYYNMSREHFDNHTNVPLPPLLEQEDYDLSARFDLNDHVIFKVEGHYMNGAGKIYDTASHPNPLSKRDTSWTMFAAKMTVSF